MPGSVAYQPLGNLVPMSEVSQRYATIADGFTKRMDGVQPNRWSSASPCAGWTARDVAIHVVNTHQRVLASLGGSEPEMVTSADDLKPMWGRAREAIRAALEDPIRSSATVGGKFGEQPFESLVGRLLCADTLIHTWDLARATGQDETLDEDAAALALEFLTPIDEAIRRPGGFGAKIGPLPGADVQTRLLNFAGRAV